VRSRTRSGVLRLRARLRERPVCLGRGRQGGRVDADRRIAPDDDAVDAPWRFGCLAV